MVCLHSSLHFQFLTLFYLATPNANGSDSTAAQNIVVLDGEDSDNDWEERVFVPRAKIWVHAPPYAAYAVFYGWSTGVFLSMSVFLFYLLWPWAALTEQGLHPSPSFWVSRCCFHGVSNSQQCSAFRAWEDAVSAKAIGPVVEPCWAQLPAPPSSPSTPSCKISPTSPCPSPFLGRYQSPSPQVPVLSPRSPKPHSVEVIKGSSAGCLHAILMAFDTEPLPYYAVLWGQCPGVYYGM